MHKHIVALAFTLATLTAMMGSISTPAYAGALRFACGGSPTGWCYWTVFYSSGGSRNIAMRNGESDIIPGLRNGDQYCFDYYGVPRTGCTRYVLTGVQG